MPTDPYTDDEYDDAYKRAHGDEPVKDKYVDETTDDPFFPSGVGGALSPTEWGIWPSSDVVDADYGQPDGERAVTAETEDEGWFGERRISLLLVVGVALFLFPEPTTSAVGVALIAVGVLAWLRTKYQ